MFNFKSYLKSYLLVIYNNLVTRYGTEPATLIITNVQNYYKLLKQNKNFGKNTNFKLLQPFFKILLTFPASSLHEGNETIIHPKK